MGSSLIIPTGLLLGEQLMKLHNLAALGHLVAIL